MKKTVKIFVFVMLLLALVVTSCSAPVAEPEPEEAAPEEAPAEEVEEPEKITIGFAAMNSGWAWFATFIDVYETRAKDNGWETITLSADADVATQLNQIQDLISKNVDYLIIGPLDSKAVIPALKEAKAAGIPTIIIGNDLDEEGAKEVTAIRVIDDANLGKYSAELMVEALADSPSKKIFIIEGQSGQPANTIRLEAFEPVFEAGGIEVVASQPADWDANKALTVTEELAAQYPDIDGVLSMDAPMTSSVVLVLEENQMDVPIVGIGGTAKELALLESGQVYGTSCNSPGMNAVSAMEVIEALVAGETVELRGVVPSPKVTLENITDCPGDW